jgi:hypothetical protein
MTKSVHLTYNVVFLMLLIIVFSSQSFAQDTDAQNIIAKMRSLDEALLQNRTLVLRMQSPAKSHHRLDRGLRLDKISVTTQDDAMAIEREMSYADAPVYLDREHPLTRGYDYNTAGKFILWRKTRTRALIESDFQGHQVEKNCFLIDPDGKVTEEEGGDTFDLYRPSDTRRYLRYWTPIWCTGRGFSKLLSRVTEVSETEDGLISFRAEGFLNPRIQGNWHMVVDPKVGYLVRSASFSLSGDSSVAFLCTTSGTKWFDAGSMAERGTIGTASNEENQMATIIQTLEHKPEPDTDLLGECRRILRGTFPPGAKVHDWQPNPKDPIAYFAGDQLLSDRDVLDAVKDADIVSKSPNDASANTKKDSPRLQDSNETKESSVPIDQNIATGQETSPPAAEPGQRSILYILIAIAVLVIVIIAIGQCRHAKSRV